MKAINSIMMSGREVLPLVEGGKGVAVSDGRSAGAWAAAGGVGTFSGTNADFYDDNGEIIDQVYKEKTRAGRHHELIDFAIQGGIAQAQRAHDLAGGNGGIHMNVLWEAGGTEAIMEGILEGAKGLVHGVTCGAGMPFKLGELASKHGVYYYPIISSARAFKLLFRRAYNKYQDFLGAVVYEDPWLAGGHNGLSNAEDPLKPQDPYPRVKELRDTMRELGLANTPIIMAGGVWALKDWEDWIDNDELGPIAFQFGTRPILTQESPVSDEWKQRLLTLKEGDIKLHQFSPTGFYSSAVNNDFLQELQGRLDREVSVASEQSESHAAQINYGAGGKRTAWIPADKKAEVEGWMASGFDTPMRTPDSTMVFVAKDKARQILADQAGCMGCLSQCRFSNWKQGEAPFTTGKTADPRSFCIQKSLQDIAHDGPVDHNLMFAGHAAFKFANDPWYDNGFIPTAKELVERICTGN